MGELNTSEVRSQAPILVVIVNYRTGDLALACLRSLAKEVLEDGRIQVVVVDNASGDLEHLQTGIAANGWSGWVRLIGAERNGGFAYGNNLAISAALASSAPPEYVVLLNPDTEARGTAIRTLANFLDARPNVGIAGSGIENQDGSDWPIAFRFPTIGSELEAEMQFGPLSRLLNKVKIVQEMTRQAAPVDWVSGACMIIRRAVFEKIGLMDERYFLYFEEVDFCRRARQNGWACWYVPQSRIMHISGESTGASGAGNAAKRMPDYWFASRSRYFVKHHGLAYARCADLAYILGKTFWHVRNFLGRQHRVYRQSMLRDFLRTSVLFRGTASIERRIGNAHDA